MLAVECRARVARRLGHVHELAERAMPEVVAVVASARRRKRCALFEPIQKTRKDRRNNKGRAPWSLRIAKTEFLRRLRFAQGIAGRKRTMPKLATGLLPAARLPILGTTAGARSRRLSTGVGIANASLRNRARSSCSRQLNVLLTAELMS